MKTKMILCLSYNKPLVHSFLFFFKRTIFFVCLIFQPCLNIATAQTLIQKENNLIIIQRKENFIVKLREQILTLRKSGKLDPRPFGTDITEFLKCLISSNDGFIKINKFFTDNSFIAEKPNLEKELTEKSKPHDWYAVLYYRKEFYVDNIISVDVFFTIKPQKPGEYTKIESVKGTLFANMKMGF